VVAAYRAGTGLSFGAYGEDVGDAQAAFNRPAFRNLLAGEWLAHGVPDLDLRLRAEPTARVLDVGCGYGWSSVALAEAYPAISVVGVDLDDASIDRARRLAAEAGVADRVTFEVRNAAEPAPAGPFDAAFIFEAVHDMPRPVEVLASIRHELAVGAPLIVMDEKVGDDFTAPGDEVERFLYCASVLHCLPVGRAEEPSVATGTVMRAATFRGYGEAAGFGSVTDLPIEHDIFRFYRLEG
jgi:SAM-dependent methyltransferase